MKKKLFALLLAFAMVVTMLPAGFSFGVSAASHEHTDHTGWTALESAGYTLSGGNYYLSGDFTAAEQININGDVTLCLAGHTLDMGVYIVWISAGSHSCLDRLCWYRLGSGFGQRYYLCWGQQQT